MLTQTPRNIAWETLPSLFPEFPDPDRWLPLLQDHARLLEAASVRVPVTTVPPEEAIRRHYAESLEIFRLIRAAGGDGPLADVGSGGGFPGLVIAIIDPRLQVHLIEPLQKRATLLREIAATLALTNVTVHALRAEEAGRGPLRGRCGVATARAVAELRVLLEYTAPLVREGGLLALAKGSALPAEITGAANALATFGCTPPAVVPMRPETGDLQLLLTSRQGSLPANYPRRPGVPERKPL